MIGGDTGIIWALNATTGENLWSYKTCSQYYVRKRGAAAFCLLFVWCSPLAARLC